MALELWGGGEEEWEGEGRREKGEGRREKGEGRREKGEGRREKGEGRREKGGWRLLLHVQEKERRGLGMYSQNDLSLHRRPRAHNPAYLEVTYRLLASSCDVVGILRGGEGGRGGEEEGGSSREDDDQGSSSLEGCYCQSIV